MRSADVGQENRGGVRWRRALRIAMVVIPIGIIGNVAFTLLATDRAVLASLAAFPRGYLFLAIGLGLVPWATNTLRLMIWTRFIGHSLGFRESFTVVLGTQLGAAVSPTAIGGGVFKWGMLTQRRISPGASASLTTLASLEDGLFFLLALPTAALMTGAWRLPILGRIFVQLRENLPTAMVLLTIMLLLIWGTMRFLGRPVATDAYDRPVGLVNRIRRYLRTAWWDAKDVYQRIIRRGKAWFALSFLLTSVQWSARYSVITALAAFLGAEVDIVLFFVLQWVVFTLMTLVPTPGATGAAEAAFYFVFGPVLPDRVIGVATAGWRFLTFYVQLALGAALFLALHGRGTPRLGKTSPRPDGLR